MNSVLQECFRERLCDLGEEDPRLAGIYAPQAEIAARKASDTIDRISPSDFKNSLLQLCAFAVDRNH